jgi:hypothetical protein
MESYDPWRMHIGYVSFRMHSTLAALFTDNFMVNTTRATMTTEQFFLQPLWWELQDAYGVLTAVNPSWEAFEG